MLRLTGVSYSYPGRDKALSGIAATLSPNVTILAGPNAGGKTTLLRLLAGLLEAREGTICGSDEGKPLTPLDLRRMGRMVMQDPEPQILGMRLGEDVMLGRAASSLGDKFDAEAERLATHFGLRDFWHENVEALSYGQKRKLCLLHALLAGPRLLLLDEPFAGLDYPSAIELRGFIRENARMGLTQVISTHELEPVFDLADHLLVVKDGSIAAEGSPGALAPRLAEWSVRRPGGGWA
jgi:biotin transport system ATP-binding protein